MMTAKIDKRMVLKNVGSSWFALALNILIGIFLSPFILHRLGDSAFGIWVLIFSITGYYGLFDVGIRSSVIRYVSKYTATGDSDKLARHINTSFATYCGIGLISMVVTVALAVYVDRLFHIPPHMQTQARWLMLMTGASVSVGFPLGMFGGMLEGLQRYYILNWSSIATTLLRAALVVAVLLHGYGLLAVAFVTVLLPVLSSVVRAVIVFRICSIPWGLKLIDRQSFHQMARFSSATMLVLLAARLRFQTDEIILGSMMSAAAITYFSIGARISDYAFQVVATMAQVFTPISSQSEALRDIGRLQRLYVVGNRACAMAALPVIALTLIMGKSIIEVWVGARYVAVSYPVLVVLMCSVGLMMLQAGSSRVLMGMGRQRKLATVAVIEGLANVILSIALIRPLGIFGDALGTAIPLTFTMLVFLPRHMRKELGVPIRHFVREAYTLPLALVLPFVITLFLLRFWFVAHTLRQLVLQATIAGAVYAIPVSWTVLTKRAFRLGADMSGLRSGHRGIAVATSGAEA
jgi:O-antigen/teichoic acid export membrane protein